jgi:osmotically-inducible protein OsmY
MGKLLMKHYTLLFLCALLMSSLLLPGCAYFTREQTLEQQRREQRYDDATIKTEIASALLRKDAARANAVSVRCFNGHVFLIGEADKEFRDEALDIARRAEGVVQVTTHWFPAGTASGGTDALIESEIESRVLRSEAVYARRVAVDAWGGHVVLTGLIGSQLQIDTAVTNIKQIKQVKSVTSYVALN